MSIDGFWKHRGKERLLSFALQNKALSVEVQLTYRIADCGILSLERYIVSGSGILRDNASVSFVGGHKAVNKRLEVGKVFVY